MRAAVLIFAAISTLCAADGIAPPPRVGVGATQRHLTLQQAVELAIAANLDVAIERTNVESAEHAVTAAKGGFDPVLRWAPSFGDSNTPAESLLQGAGAIATQHSAGQSLGFHQQRAWNGLALDAQFDSSRVTNVNPFVTLSPFYVTQLSFGITQPLLRGREIDAKRAEVTIRLHNRDASCSELEARAIDVAARVERAYWDLLAARRQAEVQREAAELAKTQLEQDRRMIEAGTLPSIELAAAEAELERRMDDLYRGTAAVTETENVLKSLLAGDRRDALWPDEIVPDDRGAVPPPAAIDIGEAIEAALLRRPELQELDSNLAANAVERRQNADLVKPQMNLAVNYTLAGLAGTQTPGLEQFAAFGLGPPPGSVVGGYGSSLANLFGGKYQSVTAGIAFDFTVHNRTAEANLASSAVAQKRIALMRARAEQAIVQQVRDSLQELETGRQRMRAAAAAARAAKDKLDSETRLFANGESTNFLVLTRQNEYSDARLRMVEAEAAFNKAVAQYEAASGTTLSERGIARECGK